MFFISFIAWKENVAFSRFVNKQFIHVYIYLCQTEEMCVYIHAVLEMNWEQQNNNTEAFHKKYNFLL